MADGYNSKVKFDSAQAERNITSLSGKIDGLRGKFANLNSTAKSFGTSLRGAGGAITTTSGRIRTLDNNITKLGSSAKSARTDIVSLGRSLNSNSFSKAASQISAMSNGLVKAAQSMGSLRAHTRIVSQYLGTFATKSTAAATAAHKLADALGRLGPALRVVSSAALLASSAQTGLAGSHRVSAAAASAHATAATKSQKAVSGVANAAASGTGKISGYAAATNQAQAGLMNMASAAVRARNVLVYFVGGFGISQLVEYADTYKLVRARLDIVTEGTNQLSAAEKKLFDISSRTRTGYRENASLFTKISMGAKTYGISANEVFTITENIGKALKISGSTAGEASAAMLQLSQAFASGRLQGDELRSVLENSPRLAQALTEELKDLGINMGNIREMAKKGKLGIEEMRRAFGGENITKKLNEEFKKMPLTIGDALKVAENRLIEFIGNVDSVSGTTTSLSKAIIYLSDNIYTVGYAALFAGGVLVASYIPSLINAIRYSKILAALSFANYGNNVRASMANAASGLGLFSGALKTSANSTLPRWKQVVGNITTATTLNFSTMFGLIRNIFMRWPVIFAVATAALYAFNNDTKVSADKLATVNDYMVTGFQAAAKGIASAFNWVTDLVTNRIEMMVDRTVWLMDRLYRAGKYAGGVAVGAVDQVGRMARGQAPQKSGVHARSMQYASSGVREDFGKAVSGTSWAREAEDRARDRKFQEIGMKLSGGTSALGIDPFATFSAQGSPTPSSSSDKSGSSKSEQNKLKREIESAKDAYLSLVGGFNEAENARKKFNDGLVTLREAMKFNIIDSKTFNADLKSLAKDTFPGLKDQMEDMAKETLKFEWQSKGADEATIKFREGAEEIKKQVAQIDQVVSKQGDVNGILSGQREALIAQLGTYREMVNQNAALKKQADDRLEKERQLKEIIDEASNNLYKMFTENIANALSVSKNTFKNFFKSILGIARDTFASIIAASVLNPIRDQFRTEMEKALGGSKALGSQKAVPMAKSSELDKILGSIGALPKMAGDSSKAKSEEKPNIITNSSITIKSANDNAKEENKADIVVTASPVTRGFIPNFTKGYKELWGQTFKDLGSVFKPVGKSLGKVANKLGINTDMLGKTAGQMFAGAQMGASVAGIGKALGIKTSTTGGAIGGAVGSIGGPLGSLAGSIVGSVVGGMLKKTKWGRTDISSSNGTLSASDAVGNNGSAMKAASAAGKSIVGGINSIMDQLGATISGVPNISVGQRHGDWRVNTGGTSLKIKKGAKEFDDDQEGAISYAIQYALQKGVISGISQAAANILKAGDDLDSALQKALSIEGIIKTARAIRDPMKSAFTEFKTGVDSMIKLFKEANASSSDWADLQLVAQNQLNDVITAQVGNLRAFRDSIKGGDLSYQSTSGMFNSALQKYTALENDVLSGKSVNQDTFTEAGQSLLGYARELYGSTPEFASYQQRLVAATEKLISNVETEAATYQPVVDAISQATKSANDNASTTNSLLESIAASVANGTTYQPPVGGQTGGIRDVKNWNVNEF